MPSTADCLAGAALTAAFLTLIGLAELWRITASPPVEWTRKLVHAGGGLTSLAIPLVIESHWVVLVLALGMGAVFLVSRAFGWLPSLHAVERRTRGVEYYPVSVYVLFLLTRGRPWLYVCCLLVLALSDAIAALVGKRFGRIQYEVDGNQKSLEGSAAFFGVTLAVIALPLLLWPDPTIPPAVNCLLVAVLAALLATGFEAISLEGRDNLWLPLGVCIVLRKLLRQPTEELVAQNIAFLGITLAIAAACYFAHAFNVGATLVFLLTTYAAWSLGSPDWAWPAAAGLMIYLAVRIGGGSTAVVRSRRITARLLLPFFTLVVANWWWGRGRTDWYVWLFGPYLAGCLAAAIVGTAISLSHRHAVAPTRRRFATLVISLVTFAVMVLPCLWLQSGVAPAAAVAVGLAGLLVGQLFATFPPPDERTAERQPWRTHLLAATAMLLVAAAQWAGVSPIWNPRE
jgi:dolichol kinase